MGPHLALKVERTGLRAVPVSSQFFLKILTLMMRGKEWEQILLGQGNGMGVLGAGEGL